MTPTRRQLIAAASAGFAVAVTGGQQRALAQRIEKPLLAKPVRIIVGFAAGGGTDATARILAEEVRGTYASTFVVENKPGAAARLAVEYVKNAEPDGSVVLFTPDFPITVYPYSFPRPLRERSRGCSVNRCRGCRSKRRVDLIAISVYPARAAVDLTATIPR
jgi:hypothetical protein